VVDAHEDATAAQQQRLTGMIARHLGEEVTPAQQDFAHRMATASSSPAAEPMEDVSLLGKKKASESPELRASTKAKGTKPATKISLPKAKAKAQAALEAPVEVPSVTVASEPRHGAPKKRASKKQSPSGASSSNDPGGQPAASSSGPAQDAGETGGTGDARHQHGTNLIEGETRKWWGRQNIARIKEQAELRGHRFSDLDTKGGMVKKDGKKVKEKKMAKADYLKVLIKKLEERGEL